MEIKLYNIAELNQLKNDSDFWKRRNLPITKHRLESHIHNPRADKEDIVLIVAEQDGCTEAYIGILPDLCISPDGEQHKFGWFSTWWVNPESQFKGIGALILLRALKLYQGNLAAKCFTQEAARVYQASNKFFTVKELSGEHLIFRLSAPLFIQKYSKLKNLRPLLDVLFGVVNAAWRLKQSRYLIKLRKQLASQLEYIGEVDDQTAAYINQRNRKEMIKRGGTEFNWIHKYPWILLAPPLNEADTHYDFQSIAQNRHERLNIKVYNSEHNLIGFLFLVITDDQMRVPYYYCDAEDLAILSRAILFHALYFKVSMLTIFQPELLQSVKKSGQHLISIKYPKEIIATQSLLKLFGEGEFQDGDGDWIFS